MKNLIRAMMKSVTFLSEYLNSLGVPSNQFKQKGKQHRGVSGQNNLSAVAKHLTS